MKDKKDIDWSLPKLNPNAQGLPIREIPKSITPNPPKEKNNGVKSKKK